MHANSSSGKKSKAKFSKSYKSSFDVILIYVWWNIYLKGVKSKFQQQELKPLQVAKKIKDDIQPPRILNHL